MSEPNQNPEEKLETAAEAAEVIEAAETEVEIAPTYEELQTQIIELEGMLKDEKLRGLANEQNLRRRHTDELQAAHKFAGQKFASEMLPDAEGTASHPNLADFHLYQVQQFFIFYRVAFIQKYYYIRYIHLSC